MKGFAFVALCLAVTVSAGPAIHASEGTLKCSGYCKAVSKFKYETGRTYVYDYRADTVTSVSGAGEEESSLHLSAIASIHVVSPCDFTLQLTNVRLEDSTPSEPGHFSEFSSALEQNALLFAFHDGKVDELCSNSADPTWVLNIKRGVLSAFQNSMHSLDSGRKLFETDVTGDCETEYFVNVVDEATTVVEKKKNLLACAHRMDHFLSLQSTPYNYQSQARSLPLVKSDHECQQIYVDDRLVKATCAESHMFRPFSNGDSGAVNRVEQRLVFKETLSHGSPGRTGGKTVRTTLLFQYTVEEAGAEVRAQTIINSLEELGKVTHDGIQTYAPKLFSQLVATLRTTSYPTLAKVFGHTRHQHLRKFLLDAMPLVGTADGLTVMTDLYKSGEISDSEMDSWLTSLTFLKRPTVTMLLATSSLLDGEPRPKAVLGLSSLVHSYCQTNPDCHETEPVQYYLNKMEGLLGDGCHVKGRKDMELKILALKGIGNMGLSTTSTELIAKCYLHPDNPLEVRLAAISAHRRLPCSGSWTNGLLTSYTDMRQDTELRIGAYLALMQCPTAFALAKVKDTLYNEEVNQVASFVWTHLTNIQETSSRWKQNIKDLVTSEFLLNKFQTDARKFSRNYEGSMFLDSLNAGATVDSNIIFTPHSYIPRFASLNLTLDVFGESINLFEVGSRVEGFEQIVEDIFGPGGYFPDSALQKVLQTARGQHNDDLTNSVDQLSKVFDANSKLTTEPQASVYARVFGNEIHYSRYQGINELVRDQLQLNNPLAFVSKLFNGQDVDYTNSFVFLDASYRFPTAIGLPLELSVNGSATVGLKVSGHLDLSYSSVDVRGRIAPSAAVRVVGTMAVDAFVTKAGLRSVSTLHTNTYLDGQATVRGSSLVDVKVNVPRETVEVLEVTAKMFVIRRDRDVELGGLLTDSDVSSDCSSAAFSRATGMRLCGLLIYPNASSSDLAPYFPLTGPVILRIGLLKADIFDAYEFNFQQQSQSDEDVRIMKLRFDTPNSRINRNIVTFLSFDRSNGALKGSLKSPFIKLEVGGKLHNSEKSKEVDFTLHMNDETIFSTKAALKTSRNGLLSRYEPSLFLAIRNLVEMNLAGKVYYIEGTKYNADFTLQGLTEKPLLFSANLNCDGDKYDMTGLIQSPLVEGSIHANLRQTNSYMNTKLTVEYSVRQAETQSINLSAKVQSSRKKSLQKRNVYVSLQMSALPQYNILVRWDSLRSENYVEYNGRFGLGKTEWQTKQLYKFHAHGSDDIEFAILCHLACPSKDIDYRAEVQYKTTDSSITTHALAQLSADHKFYSALNFARLDEQQEFSVELSCPWYLTSLKGDIVEKEPGHFATQVEGRYESMGKNGVSKVRSLVVHGTYIDGSTDDYQDHKFMLEISGVCALKLAGALTSQTRSSNMWVQLDVNRNKYKVDVEHTRNGVDRHVIDTTVLLVDRTYRSNVILVLNDIEASASIDLHLNKRIFLFTKSFHDGVSEEYEFEFMWDKDLNPSRRISLTVHSNIVKKEAILQFPGQYIKGEFVALSESVSGLLEWAEDKKIAMNVEWNTGRHGTNVTALLTTPFSGIEAQSFSSRYYKYEDSVMGIKADLAWQKEKLSFNIARETEEDCFHSVHYYDINPNYRVQVELSSTIKSITDISARYSHRHSMISHFQDVLILWGKRKVLSGSLFSEPTKLKADVYFISPFKLLPSIQGNFSRENISSFGSNIDIILNVGSDKKLVVDLVANSNIGWTGFVQVITPYTTFENTTAKFEYTNSMTDINLMTYFEFNKKITSFLLTSSKSPTLIWGSAALITPFTKPFEVGFTHSQDKWSLKEALSVSFDGQQLLSGSIVGVFHKLSSFKVTTDFTTPSQTLGMVLENQIESEISKTEIQGIWNGDIMTLSINTAKSELYLVAFASDSSSKKQYHVSLSHKHEADGVYSTDLQLFDVIAMSHKLTFVDFVNWRNSLKLKTSTHEGLITNSQSFAESNLDFSHHTIVEWNGSQIAVDILSTLDDNVLGVNNFECFITSPWTQPITMIFRLPYKDSTFFPQLKLQYQDNKEISLESEIQYLPLRSKFQVQVKSPYCNPFSTSALYDISTPTKVVLVTSKWEDKQMDLKSTVHVENNKVEGVLVLTRSDVQEKVIDAQLKCDMSKRDSMMGHFIGYYRGVKAEVDLTASLTNYIWKGTCEISTPFSSWERLTTSFNVNMRDATKQGVLVVGRNQEKVSLSGSVGLRDSLLLSAALTSSVPSVPTLSFSANLEELGPALHMFKLMFNYENHLSQFVAIHNAGAEGVLVEVSVKTPFSGVEELLGRATFSNMPDNKSFGITLMKNDEKIQIDTKCLWLGNGAGEVAFLVQTPYEGLEKLSALLKHTVRTEPNTKFITEIVLNHNDEIAEMATSIVISKDRLAVNVECVTPINDYNSIIGELSIINEEQERSMSLVVEKNAERLDASATLKFNELWNAEGSIKVISPFKGHEALSAGFHYNLSQSFRREHEDKIRYCSAKIYLDVAGIKNEVIMDVTSVTQPSELKMKVIVQLPILSIGNIDIEGTLDTKKRVFELRGKLDEQFMTLHGELQKNFINTSRLSSLVGYERVTLSTYLAVSNNKSVIQAAFNKNDIVFVVNVTASLSSSVSEFHIESTTPINNWQTLSCGAKYDLSQTKKTAVLYLAKGTEQYKLTSDWSHTHTSAEGSVSVITPVRNFKTIKIIASVDRSEMFSGRAVLHTDMHKFEGDIKITDKEIRVFMETPYKHVNNILLVGSYRNVTGTQVVLAEININEEKPQFEMKSTLAKNSLNIIMNTSFSACRTLSILLNHENLLADKTKAVQLTVLHNSATIFEISGKLGLNWESTMRFAINAVSPFFPAQFRKFNFEAMHHRQPSQCIAVLHLSKNNIAVIDMSGNVISEKEDGFKYVITLAGGLYDYDRHYAELKLHTHDSFVKFAFTKANNNTGQQYCTQLDLDNNSFKFSLSTPMREFKDLLVHLQISPYSISLDFKAAVLLYDTIKLSGKISTLNNADNFVSFLISTDQEKLEVNWKLLFDTLFMKSSFALISPFTEYKVLNLNAEYNFQTQNKTAFLSLERNNNSVQLSGRTLLKGTLSAESALNLTTSFQDLQNVKLFGGIDLNQSSHKSIIILGHVNDARQVSVNFDLETGSNKAKLIFMSITPFYETTFGAKFSYDFSDPSQKMYIDGVVSVLDIIVNVSATIMDNTKHGVLLGTFSRDIIKHEGKISWLVDNKKELKKAIISVDVGEGRKIEINTSANMNGMRNVKTMINLTMLSLDPYIITADWHVSKHRLESKLGYRWSNKQIYIESLFESEHLKQMTAIKFSSPFKNFEDINFHSKWSRENFHELSTSLQWRNDKKVMLDILHKTSQLSVKLITPVTLPLLFHLNHMFTDIPSGFEANMLSSFDYGLWKSQFNANLQVNENVDVDMTLKTPLDWMKFIHVNGKLMTFSPTPTIFVSLEKEDFKWQLSGIIYPSNETSSDVTLLVKLITPVQRLKEITLSASYDFSNIYSATISFQQNDNNLVNASFKILPESATFDANMMPELGLGYIAVKCLIDFKGPLSQLHVKTNFTGKETEFYAKINFEHDKKIVTELKMRTSWSKNYALHGIYNKEEKHTMKIAFHQGEQVSEILGSLVYELKDSELEVALDALLEGFGSLSAKAGYDLKHQQKSVHLSIRLGEQELSGTAQGGLTKNGLVGNLQIKTPLNSLKLIELKIQLEKSGSMSLRVDHNIYALHYTTIFSADSFGAKVSISSPRVKLLETLLNIKFSKNTFNVLVDIDGERVYLASSYNFEALKSFMKIKLELPFENSMKHVELNFDLDQTKSLFSSTALWNSTEKLYFTLQFDPQNFQIILETPFINIQNINITNQIVQTGDVYNVISHGAWETLAIDFTGSMQLEPINVSLNLLTKRGDIEDATMAMSLTHKERTIDLQVSGSIQGKKAIIVGEIDNKNPSIVIAKLNIDIPFYHTDPLFAEVHIIQELVNTCDIDVHVSLLNDIYTTTVNYALTDHDFKLGLDLDLPYIKSNLIMGGSFINKNNTEMDAQIFVNNNKISASMELKNKVFTGALDVHIPILRIPLTRIDAQTSLAISPSFHGTITYRSAKYEGGVAVSLSTANKAFSARIDIDLPQILGPHTHSLKFGYNYLESPRFVELRFDDGRSTRSASLEVTQKELDISVVGQVTGPSVGEKVITILLQDNLRLIVANIMDLISFEIRKETGLGSVIIKYAGFEHKMSYRAFWNKSSLDASLSMESIFLNTGNVSVRASYHIKDKSVQGYVKCDIGLLTNEAAVQLINEENTKSFSFKVVKLSNIIIKVNISKLLKNNYEENEASVEWQNKETNALLRYSPTWPIDIHLTFTSTHLSNDIFVANFKMQNTSLLANVSFGPKKSDQEISLFANLCINSTSFDAAFQVPASYFGETIALNGFVQVSQSVVHVSCRARFLSASHFSTEFLLSPAGIDAALSLHTPIQGISDIESIIKIPFTLTNNFDLKLLLSVPSAEKYALHARVKSMDNSFELATGAQWGSQSIGGELKLVLEPTLTFDFEIHTPFDGFKKYQVQLRGVHNIEGDDVVNYVLWNDKRIEMRHSAISSENKIDYRIQLITPFRNYNRYVVGLQCEYDVHKKVLAFLSLPGMKDDFKIEFDFRLNNLIDSSFFIDIRMPIFSSFKMASLLVGTKFDIEKLSYRGVINGNYNTYEFLTTLDGTLKQREVKMEFNSLINGNKVNVLIDGGFGSFGVAYCTIDVSTPIHHFKNGKISILLKPEGLEMFQVNLIFNSKELFHLQIGENQNMKVIEVRNPWRPVSLGYSFKQGKHFEILGEICWNLSNKAKSQFSAGFTSIEEPNGKRQVSATIRIPTRDVSLNYSYHHSSSILDNAGSFSWQRGHMTGYRIHYQQISERDWNVLARLDFPSRAFEVTSHMDSSDTQGNIAYKFMWDAAEDESKRMGVNLMWTLYSAELTLQHAAFEHSITLRVEQDNCVAMNHNHPSSIKLALEYSQRPEDLLTVGVFYQGSSAVNPGLKTFFSVFHSSSNLDHNILFSLENSKFYSSRLSINYKSFDSGDVHLIETSGILNINEPKFEISILDSKNKLTFGGSLWSKENGYHGFTMRVVMNQKEPLKLEGQVSLEEMRSELDISYGSTRGYTIRAGMPTPRIISAGITRTLQGLSTPEALVVLKLNTSRLLWTQVRWRPGMIDHMKQPLFQEYADITLVAENIINSFAEVFDDNPYDRLEKIYSSISSQSFSNIGEYTANEVQDVFADFENIIRITTMMYENNDFYCKDIHRVSVAVISYIQEKSVCFMKQLFGYVSTMFSTVRHIFGLLGDALYVYMSQITRIPSTLKNFGRNILNHTLAVVIDLKNLVGNLQTTAKSLLLTTKSVITQSDRIVKELYQKGKACAEDVETLFHRALQTSISRLQHHVFVLRNSLLTIERSVSEMVTAVFSTVMEVKELKELVDLYDSYSGWLEEFQVQTYIDNLLQYFRGVRETLVNDFQRMFADYKTGIDSVLGMVSGQIEMVDSIPAVTYTKNVINSVHHKITWMWEYYNLSAYLKLYIQNVIEDLDDNVTQLLYSLQTDSDYTRYRSHPLVIRRGYVEVTQKLPVHWESFQQWPDFSQITKSSQVTASTDSYYSNMMTALKKMTPTFSDTSLLPPFGAVGFVVGKQHFITFDHLFYDFVGECSYLLAGDLLDNKFSIIVNYDVQDDNNLKKSLTILSEGQRIDISPNYQVTVNDKKTELPAAVGNAIVISRNGDRLLVESENNMAIDCNLVHDICAIELTGWNFGKTGGLLGTFNNEPSDDFAFPNGTKTSDIASFASEWRVGDKNGCRLVNRAVVPPANDDAIDACDTYFTYLESPIADCFALVDPMPFYHMCISDMAGMESELGICTAAVTYAAQCRTAGVQAALPDKCAQCQLPNIPVLSAGESKVLNGGIEMSADIVFVVEQAGCINGFNLAKMATKLDAALIQQGLLDNRFSVVGFGGDTFPKPHVRTSKGDIWTSGRGTEKAFSGLVLADEDGSRDEQSVYEALKFASQLSFRGGVSKTVVLVQCSPCGSQLDYGEMMGLLMQNDIKLHLLEPSAIAMRDGAHTLSGKVIGADLSGIYTARTGRNIKPDANMLKQMILPKDHCSPLAFETNGTVFNLELSSNKGKQVLKKFVEVWSRRVAQAARPSPCQKCECVTSDDGVGKVQCAACVTASVDQFLLDWQSLLTDDYAQIALLTAESSEEETV